MNPQDQRRIPDPAEPTELFPEVEPAPAIDPLDATDGVAETTAYAQAFQPTQQADPLTYAPTLSGAPTRVVDGGQGYQMDPQATQYRAGGTQATQYVPADQRATQYVPADQQATRYAGPRGAYAAGSVPPVPPVPPTQPTTGYEPQEDYRPQFVDPEPPRKRSKAPLVIVALLLVAAAVGAAFFIRNNIVAEQQKTYPVPFEVSAPVSLAGASALPLHVSGTSAAGVRVESTVFAPTDGSGVKLEAGSYKLTGAGSPIAADGTLFEVPELSIDVTVNETSGYAGGAATSCTLTPIEAWKVTDTQINDAYKLAMQGGAVSSDIAEKLRATATAKRDEALAAHKAEQSAADAERQAEEEAAKKAEEERKKSEEEERKKAEEEKLYHYYLGNVSFWIPEYWRGKVHVVSSASSAEGVTRMDVADDQYGIVFCHVSNYQGAPFDEGDGSLDYLWTNLTPTDGEDVKKGCSGPALDVAVKDVSGLSDKQRDHIVDLLSGGTHKGSEFKAWSADDPTANRSIYSSFLTLNLVSTIK